MAMDHGAFMDEALYDGWIGCNPGAMRATGSLAFSLYHRELGKRVFLQHAEHFYQ